jgi:autotransporter strand-loop-strand O-heptosyltransferase
MGYQVVIIQQEPNQWSNVVDLTGDIPIEHRLEVLRGAEFFIGLPSGLSWLAWAAEIPVVMISGFSDEFAEFQFDLYRVTNKSVCNSCWNDPTQIFDKGDWWWCPRNKNTERHFECTKTITPEMVMERIHQLREEKNLL